MISHLTGTVTAVGPTWVVVDLGGFGVKALCTPATAGAVRLGREATLATSLVVREDSLTLYGFAATDERDCFELVQSASGVGPKLAQAIVSVLAPDDLRSAIAGENLAALTRVPGIGVKGAQRLVLELKDKVTSVAEEAGEAVLPAASDARSLARDGLINLGYAPLEAEQLLDGVGDGDDPQQLIGAALKRAAASGRGE